MILIKVFYIAIKKNLIDVSLFEKFNERIKKRK